MTELRQQLDRIEGRLDRIETLLTDRDGLLVRMDRNEQTLQRHAFWTKAALTTCISTVIAAVAKLLFGH